MSEIIKDIREQMKEIVKKLDNIEAAHFPPDAYDQCPLGHPLGTRFAEFDDVCDVSDECPYFACAEAYSRMNCPYGFPLGKRIFELDECTASPYPDGGYCRAFDACKAFYYVNLLNAKKRKMKTSKGKARKKEQHIAESSPKCPLGHPLGEKIDECGEYASCPGDTYASCASTLI
jgi:hypothetical protein